MDNGTWVDTSQLTLPLSPSQVDMGNESASNSKAALSFCASEYENVLPTLPRTSYIEVSSHSFKAFDS